MNREFYYLDGKNSKGPCSIDELMELNLSSDKLIWDETVDSWKPLREIEELNILLKEVGPLSPPDDDMAEAPNEHGVERDDVALGDADGSMKLKLVLGGVVAVGLASLVGYGMHNLKKTELRSEAYSKIDRVLQGKTVVLDGQFGLSVGELTETGYNPKASKKDDDIRWFAKWWEREEFYEVFEATGGGFSIVQLTRQSEDGFDIETTYSGDMGFKIPARTYVPPSFVNLGGSRYQTGGGYWRDNYRLSVRDCYKEAFNYFTVEDTKSPGAYSPGKYVDIVNFPDIWNEFFYMDNTLPRQSSAAGIFSAQWESTGDHSANISTDDWVVYTKVYGKHYELTENKSAIQKDLLIKVSLAVGLVLLVFALVLLLKPKFLESLG